MMEITITFEVSEKLDESTVLPLADALHEDLCLSIHELNYEALKRLQDYIVDIKLTVPVVHKR